jgi:uroporphyrinogen decarboxylase
MIPQFEEKVLAHRDGHYVVQDWKGNVCEISDRFDVSYLRHAIDFVTRRWIRLPVESREDWQRMKERYEPADPARFPDDFAERCRRLRGRDYVSTAAFAGPFWQMREWVGFERLCTIFADEPDWVAEMVAFYEEFVSRTMAPLLEAGAVDHVFISEDMAFKGRSMVSPAMARRLLLPCWRRWTREAHAAGVPVVDMDSDGYVAELIPLWVEAGIDVCDPVEVAAGNDIADYRRRWGERIAFRMGVDKRAIARGGRAIEAELARLAPVVRGGGYVPGCDHGVPPDVSWPDFVRYARLLAELTGWL